MNASLATAADAAKPWKTKLLVIDANESLDIGDVNKDGVPDIVAGRNWYEGPDYTPRPVRTIEDFSGYVESNCDFLYDVNKDGWLDVISMSFMPTTIHYYQNPGEQALKLGQLWKKVLLVDTKNAKNEGCIFQDIDGDQVPELLVNSWDVNSPLVAWKLAYNEVEVEKMVDKKKTMVKENVASMIPIMIGKRGNGHGMGIGDLNGDSRIDILVGTGWYEQPAEHAWDQEWIYHPVWKDLHAPVPCIVHDFNGDGKNDLMLSKAHGYGVYWWENDGVDDKGEVKWKEHDLDDFSQAHTFTMSDLNHDGKLEFLTGKRYRAHNGNDPGASDPLTLHYYNWNGEKKGFDKTIISQGSTVGGGLYIKTADLDGDGDLDVAVAGKSGTYVLTNPAK
jgi:hypothetical protein